MTPGSDSGGRIRFGAFEVDPQSGELFKDGRRVPLPNQSFLALSALLERPGQLVSREVLRARLWPDNRVVEFEQGLNAIINRLREALGDSAGNARFIETLPRRGYRFIAAVEAPPAAVVVGTSVGGPAAAGSAAGAGASVGGPAAAGSAAGVGASVAGPAAALASGPAAVVADSGVAVLGTVDGSRRGGAAGHRWGIAAGAPGALVARVALVAFVGLAALAAIAAIVALVRFVGGRADTDELSNIRVQPLTSLIGREVAPAFSPDGQRFAFAWNGKQGTESESGGFDLYVKSVDSERTLQLTHTPATSIAAAWSTDGRQIAFARTTDRASGIYSLPSTGGPEKLLASAMFLDDSLMQLSWSRDGRLLAYASIVANGPSLIHLLSLEGRKSHALERPPSCRDTGAPAFSPNGQQLAFLCTSTMAVYGVYVMTLPSGTPRLLASLQGNPRGLAWMASGAALIVANDAADGSALWRLSLNGQLSRIPVTEEALGAGVAVVGDRIAFVRETHLIDIRRADLTSPAADAGSALIGSTRMQLVPQYSPDGARIAFESTRSGSPEIWLADADGANPVKLTSFNGPLTGAPSWCSDGRRIAFDSRASGTSAIYIADVLEGRSHRLETTETNLALPAWSEDCRWIFASDGRARLFRVAASGGAAEVFTDRPAYRAIVSGQRVVFNVAGPAGVELWSKPADGGAETPLDGMPHLSYSDSWGAAPRGIYYTHGPTVGFYDFASHSSRTVRSLAAVPTSLGGLGIAVSKDEHWLLYTHTAQWQGDIMMVSGSK